jgi:hypothetical protein
MDQIEIIAGKDEERIMSVACGLIMRDGLDGPIGSCPKRRVLAVVELLDRIVRDERALFCWEG